MEGLLSDGTIRQYLGSLFYWPQTISQCQQVLTKSLSKSIGSKISARRQGQSETFYCSVLESRLLMDQSTKKRTIRMKEKARISKMKSGLKQPGAITNSL